MLRDDVKYPPLTGKYKVVIIDEVHMLSNNAFNALLKRSKNHLGILSSYSGYYRSAESSSDDPLSRPTLQLSPNPARRDHSQISRHRRSRWYHDRR